MPRLEKFCIAPLSHGFQLPLSRKWIRASRLDEWRASRLVGGIKKGEKFGLEITESRLREALGLHRGQARPSSVIARLARRAREKGAIIVPLEDDVLYDIHHEVAMPQRWAREEGEHEEADDNLISFINSKADAIMSALRSAFFMHKMQDERTLKNAMGLFHAAQLKQTHPERVEVKPDLIPRIGEFRDRRRIWANPWGLTGENAAKLMLVLQNPSAAQELRNRIARAVLGNDFAGIDSDERIARLGRINPVELFKKIEGQFDRF